MAGDGEAELTPHTNSGMMEMQPPVVGAQKGEPMTPHGPHTGRRVDYTDQRGRQPSSEYLRRLPAMERAIVAHELDPLRLLRPGDPIPHARQIRGKLWELELGDSRLLYCT